MLYDIKALFRILGASEIFIGIIVKFVAAVVIVVIIVVVAVLAAKRSRTKKAEGKMYCKKCGAQMSEYDQICEKCGTLVREERDFCPNCGLPISPQARFCSGCGYAVGRPVQFAQQKSKIAAGLFGIFLGGLGVHNFYLGFKGKAIAQLLISILSFGLLAWVSIIWGLIEGIVILASSNSRDANGIPLKD